MKKLIKIVTDNYKFVHITCTVIIFSFILYPTYYFILAFNKVMQFVSNNISNVDISIMTQNEKIFYSFILFAISLQLFATCLNIIIRLFGLTDERMFELQYLKYLHKYKGKKK